MGGYWYGTNKAGSRHSWSTTSTSISTRSTGTDTIRNIWLVDGTSSRLTDTIGDIWLVDGWLSLFSNRRTAVVICVYNRGKGKNGYSYFMSTYRTENKGVVVSSVINPSRISSFFQKSRIYFLFFL